MTAEEAGKISRIAEAIGRFGAEISATGAENMDIDDAMALLGEGEHLCDALRLYMAKHFHLAWWEPEGMR